jgi:hypothetical protein
MEVVILANAAGSGWLSTVHAATCSVSISPLYLAFHFLVFVIRPPLVYYRGYDDPTDTV